MFLDLHQQQSQEEYKGDEAIGFQAICYGCEPGGTIVPMDVSLLLNRGVLWSFSRNIIEDRSWLWFGDLLPLLA